MKRRIMLLICMGLFLSDYAQKPGLDSLVQEIIPDTAGTRFDKAPNPDEPEQQVQQAQAAESAAGNERAVYIRYTSTALTMVGLILGYLLSTRSFIADIRVIQAVQVMALLITFQLLNLVLQPFLKQITNNSLPLTILAIFGIAAILVPLHQKLGKWTNHQLTQKNKKIRLNAARKTINNKSASQ
jgi:hypothetical protein